MLASRAQGVALLHAKAVLFVHDDEPEVRELHRLAEQRVGPDHNSGGTRRGLRERNPPLLRALRTREQHQSRRVVGAGEHATGGERTKQLAQRPRVLGGEHLRGCEQRGLAPGVDHLQHGSQRDHGLACANVSLEQPQHGHAAREVSGDLRAHGHLARGQRERQPRVERVDEPVCHGAHVTPRARTRAPRAAARAPFAAPTPLRSAAAPGRARHPRRARARAPAAAPRAGWASRRAREAPQGWGRERRVSNSGSSTVRTARPMRHVGADAAAG